MRPPERRKLTAFSVCSETYSKVVRKSIARVLTVINQNKKQAVREAYADKVSPTPALQAPHLELDRCFCAGNPRAQFELSTEWGPERFGAHARDQVEYLEQDSA